MEKKLSAQQDCDPAKVFECRMCGACCQGQGGIVVGPRDLPRLCAHLHMHVESFIAVYCYMQNAKIAIRTSPDGYCIFFLPGIGCSIHIAKPDICLAWPYFRGNMLDEASFAMAKEFCPGINPVVGHDTFVRAGLRYLEEHQLRASDPKHEANALIGVLP